MEWVWLYLAVFVGSFAGAVAAWFLIDVFSVCLKAKRDLATWERAVGSKHLTPLEQDMLRQWRQWSEEQRGGSQP